MSNNKRYEYKFVLKDISFLHIVQVLRLHPFGMNEVFVPRWINNIYYDTSDLNSFHENASGDNRRTKYRVRWYGVDYKQMNNPVLEVKNKEDLLGWKDYIKLDHFNTNQNINDILVQSDLVLPNIFPVIQNRYLRDYFLSSDKKFRVTIDRFIGHRLPISNQNFLEEEKIVVEVKFDKKDEALAKQFFDYLPFRQKKNSKFACGIELLY